MHLKEVKNTALLLFTRSAEEEAVAKDFTDVHSFHANLLIAKNLISRSEKIARESGLPCFTINTDLQTGNSFGERLNNAFKGIFKLGFENVIAIGNDCPTLTPTDLVFAARELQIKDVVIGPATDGGLYLIGLNNNFLRTELFSTIPWGTDQVSTAFIQYLDALSADFIVTEQKMDLDHKTDLIKTILDPFLSFSFRQILAGILASIDSFCNTLFRNPLTTFFRKYNLLRGPPAV